MHAPTPLPHSKIPRSRFPLATLLLHQRLKSNSIVNLDDPGRITGFLERPVCEFMTRGPKTIAAGSLAIDALASMVDTLGDRLAPHDQMLRDAVTQLRMAFVQLTDRANPDPPS